MVFADSMVFPLSTKRYGIAWMQKEGKNLQKKFKKVLDIYKII
jgi:hypothetical protein